MVVDINSEVYIYIDVTDTKYQSTFYSGRKLISLITKKWQMLI